jgi:hypothetical protein
MVCHLEYHCSTSVLRVSIGTKLSDFFGCLVSGVVAFVRILVEQIEKPEPAQGSDKVQMAQ